MGGLAKYMPITYWTVLIGAIANAGLPPFSGFFSKDSIVEALSLSHTPGAHFAWLLALGGIFVSGLYSFRLVFFAFHGEERFGKAEHGVHGGHGGESVQDAIHKPETARTVEEPGHEAMHGPPHETPAVVTVPLILLAIPSVFIGALTIGPMLYGGWFVSSTATTETRRMLTCSRHQHQRQHKHRQRKNHQFDCHPALSSYLMPDGDQHCHDYANSRGIRKSGYHVDDARDTSETELRHSIQLPLKQVPVK